MLNEIEKMNSFKRTLRYFFPNKKLPNINLEWFNEFKIKPQADKILWHLENFEKITNKQCHIIYGIRHCPSVIRNLRHRFLTEKSKYKIVNLTHNDFNFWGQKVTYDDYILTPID